MSVDILTPSAALRWFDEAQRPPDAMPTHLAALNRVCGDNGGGIGLGMGWHVVVGGDTGHGKSLLALNLCKDAVQAGERIGFISLEMGRRNLQTRFYSMLTMTPVRDIEPGPGFKRTSAEAVTKFVEEQTLSHGRSPFFVSEPGFTEIGDVIGTMEEWRKQGCRVFVIDYLQLCSAGDDDSMTRELVRISSAVREWTHSHDVLTLALSQYNYAASKNRQVPPTIHSLYGSARIGQDADLCLLLDHSRYERVEDWYNRGGFDVRYTTAKTYLIIGKNRHGDGGDIPIAWDYRTLTSREGLPDELHQWPGGDR